MSFQYATDVRDNWLDSIETTIGTSPILKIWSGSVPANCAAADSGTLLADITLPSDWMGAASGGSKAGGNLPWTDATADNNGTAGHFRLYDSGGSTCKMQGTATATGGGGDLQLSTVSITAGAPVEITNFTLNANGA